MEWKDIAGVVGKAAPILGTLLGGPAGAAIGGIVASALGTEPTPSAVSQALSANPDAAVKLAQIEADQKVKFQELATDQAKSEIAAAAQAISDTWRPFIGFITGIMLIGVYFVLPLAHIPVPPVPESVWLMLGGILGVASFFRGKMQADPSIPTINRG